jgi:putative transcriptional regulator
LRRIGNHWTVDQTTDYRPVGQNDMSKTTTIAKMRPDGAVVEVLDDGSERPLAQKPMWRMTEAEIQAAAAADPDARPMTLEELRTARRVQRARTLRRALGLTQEEFALRYLTPAPSQGRQ